MRGAVRVLLAAGFAVAAVPSPPAGAVAAPAPPAAPAVSAAPAGAALSAPPAAPAVSAAPAGAAVPAPPAAPAGAAPAPVEPVALSVRGTAALTFKRPSPSICPSASSLGVPVGGSASTGTYCHTGLALSLDGLLGGSPFVLARYDCLTPQPPYFAPVTAGTWTGTWAGQHVVGTGWGCALASGSGSGPATLDVDLAVDHASGTGTAELRLTTPDGVTHPLAVAATLSAGQVHPDGSHVFSASLSVDGIVTAGVAP